MPASAYGERVRVVVADNDADALDLVELDLGLEGHDVVATATGGEEAIEVCRAHQPDVLVVDYRMPPGPNGVDVARAVLEGRLAGRVVIYSNYDDPKVVATAERMGATWLRKGNLATLRRAVALSEHP